MSFEEFESRVAYKEPWRGGVYIVDGDIPIPTKAALKEYYLKNFLTGELIVHQAGGADAAWSATQKKNLTYCISDGFGANKQKMIDAMKKATAEGWELYGDIKFVYLAAEDKNCTATNNNVVFDVRQVSGQSYLARAFFPDQTRSTRNVLVDTSSFDPNLSWPLSGIIAHELGHSLGFRHEHTRPESGATQCFEDNNWRPLTAYDSTSVMHYPQCNGTGTPLTISNADKSGIASLYGPAGAAVCGDAWCSGNETCADCPDDCGACPECGDGTCQTGEGCENCPSDCGDCPVCGDGTCNGTEDCSTCEGDCGECVCGHDLCATGPKLEATCDPCVAKICAADPFCCNNSWDSLCVGQVASVCGGSCAPTPVCGDGTCNGTETCDSCPGDCGVCACTHDLCVTGPKLKANCDACATKVCAKDAYCCNSSWDSTCVAEVGSICGKSCGGASCAHKICVTGAKLKSTCDPCVAKVCAVDSYCCKTSWDSVCVAEVKSVCGQTCQ